MIEIIVPTDKKKLSINFNIYFESNFSLSALGYDKNNTKTTFFNRLITPASNIFNVDFPLPISPRKLVIQFNNDNYVPDNMYSILEMDIDTLNNPGVELSLEDYENIKWIIDFCKDASYKLDGIYYGPNKMFINYMPRIIDEVEGEIPTPARIDHVSAETQVNSTKFRLLTVPQRVVILIHEYWHWRLDTKDETECDLQSLRVCLGLGFPKTECIYSFTNILSDSHQNEKRLKQIVNYIHNFNG